MGRGSSVDVGVKGKTAERGMGRGSRCVSLRVCVRAREGERLEVNDLGAGLGLHLPVFPAGEQSGRTSQSTTQSTRPPGKPGL